MSKPSHEYCKDCKDWNGNITKCFEICCIPIDIIKEWEKYHAIGTVEDLMVAKEKQIPNKPILKHDVSVMHINRGNQPHEWKRLESDNWHCPECDSFVGERVYVHSKVHDQRKKKYCDHCGQKLNWESDEE